MVRLVPMTNAEFQVYLALAVDDYAQEHVLAGNWLPEEAHQKSAQEFKHLLPDGVASKDQYLFSIEDTPADLKIGMLWFAVTSKGTHRTAFIYDFIIDEAHRGQGYGRQALAALDGQAAGMGVESISLHVFGHNPTAIALYEKMGYRVTDLHMAKKITP
ncbi:MAG: N-acetyltransferase [Chloroflexi bacterium]|nr:N-acetyltransferase [Chloroflexota bacterium]